MTVHGLPREASIEIHASPQAVSDLVSDLPRMGEWSPENIGGEWQDSGSGKVGDRSIGHNRTSERSWLVPVLVAVAERDRCFAFVTRPDEGPYVRWTYRLEPSGTGTRVTGNLGRGKTPARDAERHPGATGGADALHRRYADQYPCCHQSKATAEGSPGEAHASEGAPR
jgi:hypothetical protein